MVSQRNSRLAALAASVASSIPATLVLFFVQDRLEAPLALQPLFLGSYFLVGALSMPLWLRCVRRFGLGFSWLMGMGLAIVVFLAAWGMGTGDIWPFVAVCAISGLALGRRDRRILNQ